MNFGVFKHPNPDDPATASSATSVASTFESAQTSTDSGSPERRIPDPNASTNVKLNIDHHSHGEGVAVVEKLQKIGLTCVAWIGRCEADKATEGSYDVPESKSGMYGLVFDNTFSRQTSKTVMFVLMTYPTKLPPRTGQDTYPGRVVPMAAVQAGGAGGAGAPGGLGAGGVAELRANSPRLSGRPDSSESLSRPSLGKIGLDQVRRRSSYVLDSSNNMSTSTFHTGILQKKRRKRNQGYARRFFSLDFTTSTLTYYHDRHSSALRGSIPLSLAAIHADERSRQISVDSGAEIWHLKASNSRDFEVWKAALDKASSALQRSADTGSAEELDSLKTMTGHEPVTDDQDWNRVEILVDRLIDNRNALRQVTTVPEPRNLSFLAGHASEKDNGLPSPGLTTSNNNEESGRQEDSKSHGKTAFWRRKGSNQSHSPSSLFRRTSGQQLSLQSQNDQPQPSAISLPKRPNNYDCLDNNEDVHDNQSAITRELDAIVADFSSLLSERRRRLASTAETVKRTNTRASIDSTSTMEFFDAQEDPGRRSRMTSLRRYSDESDDKQEEESSSGDSGTSSDEEDAMDYNRKYRTGGPSLFPEKPKSLIPLPLERVKRRSTVPEPRVPPPSLISFLRKNVGKDLSTIAMPVTANEPLSLLQKLSEQFEYSELLDAAVGAKSETGERLLYVTAFAISSFSGVRVKERVIRKPFNPMLGETYELVREDKGFRLLAEKVSHRPVRMAIQAESQNWTFLHSPAPVQKFWGKSAELNTYGRAHVILYPSTSSDSAESATASSGAQSERYSWSLATSFLRNVLAGEKYVEPVGSMTIVNEGTGAKAVVTFVKSSGMFSGRSEDVKVQLFGPAAGGGAGAGASSSSPLPLGLSGKWTSHLSLTEKGTDTGKKIWTVGSLVQDASRCYGFTSFAAQLNEITPIESETGNVDGSSSKRNSNGSGNSSGNAGLRLPPTDSRLRPDERAVETGDIERAEALKARLEERQRSRRKVMEEHDEPWVPRWFELASGNGNGDVGGSSGGNGNAGTASGESEEIWRLKAGKDGYWEQRARGDWSCITDVFQV